MTFGREALARWREQGAQPERPASPLATVPADAPCDEPDALVHVWDGERWIPWAAWRATAAITVAMPPAPAGSIRADAERVAATCGAARVWLLKDAERWLMYVGSRRPGVRRRDFASPFLAHAMRTAEVWYGAPAKGWREEQRGLAHEGVAGSTS
jgi:hypothetical protein